MVTVSEVFAAGKYREHPQDEIDKSLLFLQSGEIVSQLEGDKLALIKKHNYYALMRNKDNQILCWVELKPCTVGNISGLELMMIYVLPQFRNSAVTSILLFSVKHILNKSIIVDGAVSEQGQMLLKAVAKRPKHFRVNYVNRKTGDTVPYIDGILEPYETDHVLVVEQKLEKFSNVFEHTLPGGYVHKFTLSFFEADHEDLMN